MTEQSCAEYLAALAFGESGVMMTLANWSRLPASVEDEEFGGGARVDDGDQCRHSGRGGCAYTEKQGPGRQ